MTLLEEIFYLHYIEGIDLDDIYLTILDLTLKQPEEFKKLPRNIKL